MTTTPSSTATTTPTRPGANKAPLTLYDYTGTDNLTRTYLPALQSLIGLAIERWWTSLTGSQRSALHDRYLSLKISASCQQATPLIKPEDC